MYKRQLQANIAARDVRVLPVFQALQELGGVPERDMFNTFNMGVGLTVIVAAADAAKAVAALEAAGETAYVPVSYTHLDVYKRQSL